MIKSGLVIMVLIVMMTGCFKQEPTLLVKEKFVYEKPYGFETIDLDGVYIDLNNKRVQALCTPSLLELNTAYRGVVEFYEDQINRYKEDRYNDKSGRKISD